jgi:hypothetical protein
MPNSCVVYKTSIERQEDLSLVLLEFTQQLYQLLDSSYCHYLTTSALSE